MNSPPALFNTRIAVVIAALIAFIATVAFFCPLSKTLAFAVIFSDGVLAFAWVLAQTALGHLVLKLFKIKSNPLLQFATAAGLGLGIMSLLALTLGLLGWLNRITALALPAASVLLITINWLKQNRHRQFNLTPIKTWLKHPADFSWFWLIPVISLSIAASAATVLPGILWKPLDPHPYDVTSYHLQIPREWYEAKIITPLPHNVFSYFPFNTEMQFLLLMHIAGGPWAAMYACQFLSLACMLLMILTIAGAIPPPGKPVIGAALASAVPWIIMLAAVAYVESALLLYTALAITWILGSSDFGFWILDFGSEDNKSALLSPIQNPQSKIQNHAALSGALAGFACGVKITAVPMLLLAIPIALLLTTLLHKPRTFKRILPAIIIFLAAGALALSPWLLRNLFWAGNPIFPIAMKTLGHAHFSLDQMERFRLAHSPTPAQESLAAKLQIVWTDILAHWQFGYVLLPAGVVAALLRLRDRQTQFLLITAAVIFITWIGFTHLLPRFLIMLVPIAAILVARLNWQKRWPIAIALLLAAACLGWFNIYQPLASVTRDPVGSQLIAREDLNFMTPPELQNIFNSEKQIGLVGNAGAFLYQVPMTRLHYKSVFDVPADTDDPIAAWVNPAAESDPNWLFVISPNEIDRLHRTYWKIPALPEKWQNHSDEPFVLRGGSIPSSRHPQNLNPVIK